MGLACLRRGDLAWGRASVVGPAGRFADCGGAAAVAVGAGAGVGGQAKRVRAIR